MGRLTIWCGTLAMFALTVGWASGRDPAHLVESELLEGEPGERDVGVVHRVEAAAEKTDALHGAGAAAGGARSAHSRGGRKSV